MHTEVAKQYLPLAGRTVIEFSLETLLAHPRITGALVVVDRDDQTWTTIKPIVHKPLLTAVGSTERYLSVLCGIEALTEHCSADDWVLVHDAARPCLHPDDLARLLETLWDDPVGGLLAVPASDTIKRGDSSQRIDATLDRSMLWHAQTPQMFRFGLLARALQQARERRYAVTDEASAIEALAHAPRLVTGRRDNLKITHPEDLALANYYLTQARD